MAPDARSSASRWATADGGADVSQVIAAIDWVVQHAHDPGLNIRVINLSYGTNSTQSLRRRSARLRRGAGLEEGIVVVAAAGNSGYQRGNGAPGLADPAYNPYVLAVGGSDSMGTTSQKDDRVGAFSASSAGCGGCKKPDLVAPGVASAGPACAELVARREPPGGHGSDRPLFRGRERRRRRRSWLRRRRARAPAVSDDTPGPRQALPRSNARQAHGLRHPGAGQRCRSGLAQCSRRRHRWSTRGRPSPPRRGAARSRLRAGRITSPRDGVVLTR